MAHAHKKAKHEHTFTMADTNGTNGVTYTPAEQLPINQDPNRVLFA